MAETKLMHVPLDQIIEPETKLRIVDKETEEFLGLVDSIRDKGVMNPINVRELQDPETGNIIYGIIDGLHRYVAAKDAGKDSIPAQVLLLKDGELEEAQIIANVHVIETKPVEYSKALLRILERNPLMSRGELANRLHKTNAWISERLGLLKLVEEVGKLVDDKTIGLSNAYALAKLDPNEQVEFVDRAISMPPQQFWAVVNTRLREIRSAKRKGKDAGPPEFQPVALIRTKKELIDEMDHPKVGPYLCKELKPANAEEAFALAVQWSLNLDAKSIEIQKTKDDERKAERERQKELSQVERKKKRAKEAAEKAEQLQKEVEQADVEV